jgi:hypothetical protein
LLASQISPQASSCSSPWPSSESCQLGRAADNIVERSEASLPARARSLPLQELRSGKRLSSAVLVDVDGTLVSPYRQGQRELRSSALQGLALLAERAPVFLWSIAGPDNGARLLNEFPQVRRHVLGSFAKDAFPLDLVDRPYAIDDEALDAPVLRCRHFILDTTYEGGRDSEDFLRAARAIVADLCAWQSARRS